MGYGRALADDVSVDTTQQDGRKHVGRAAAATKAAGQVIGLNWRLFPRAARPRCEARAKAALQADPRGTALLTGQPHRTTSATARTERLGIRGAAAVVR